MPATLKVVRKQKIKLPSAIVGHTKAKIGFPSSKTGQEVLDKAIFTHFGTATIPERPFISNAFRDNRAKYLAALRKAASSVLIGKTEPGEVATKLGISMQGDIQTEMVNLSDPPNAPSTIAKKGVDNPTIDTGETKNSVTWETYD